MVQEQPKCVILYINRLKLRFNMLSHDLSIYIADFYREIPDLRLYESPWMITERLGYIIQDIIPTLSPADYHISGTIAIHKQAEIEQGATIREHTIIGQGSVVKAGAYLRNGVYLAKNVSIGANCEIKQSIIFKHSRIAHLNYVGNSLIGEDVNIEAGAVLANHFNERINKQIEVLLDGRRFMTNATKFGSLLGDGCRIGANAVLNPGTILAKASIVERLTHLDQLRQNNSQAL